MIFMLLFFFVKHIYPKKDLVTRNANVQYEGLDKYQSFRIYAQCRF